MMLKLIEYQVISSDEAEALWQCGVNQLEYKFEGITVDGHWVEWAKFYPFRGLWDSPIQVDIATEWRVQVE